MRQLVSTRQYGIGTVTRTRVLDDDTQCHENKKSWADMTEEEKQQDSYRSNISHIRQRMKDRVLSSPYLFHVVFTTTWTALQKDVEYFRDIVINELERQGINYCLFPELYHKEQIWLYDADAPAYATVHIDGYTATAKDSIVNAYGCFNRRAFSPLSNTNGFHIHAITDKPVDFLHYIQTVPCDTKNLYCEVFDDVRSFLLKDKDEDDLHLSVLDDVKLSAQIKNYNYMSKLLFYSKSKLPKDYRFLRTNNKKVICNHEDVVIDEFGEIIDIYRNDINLAQNNINGKNVKAFFSNVEEYKLTEEYQRLKDFDKFIFEIDYIRSLMKKNEEYKNVWSNYKILKSEEKTKIEALKKIKKANISKDTHKNSTIKSKKSRILEEKRKKRAYLKQNNIVDFINAINRYFVFHSNSLVFKDSENNILLNLDILNESIIDLYTLKNSLADLIDLHTLSNNLADLKVLNQQIFNITRLNVAILRDFYDNLESTENTKQQNIKTVSNLFKNIDMDDAFKYNFWDLMIEQFRQSQQSQNIVVSDSDVDTDICNNHKAYVANIDKHLSVQQIGFRQYPRRKIRRCYHRIQVQVSAQAFRYASFYGCMDVTPYTLPCLSACACVLSFGFLFGIQKASLTSISLVPKKEEIYALNALNRMSCKRFKRKKRKLQIKKSTKYKFMVKINYKISLILLNAPKNWKGKSIYECFIYIFALVYYRGLGIFSPSPYWYISTKFTIFLAI